MSLQESPRDTIAAISTAPGEGGIGIIRLSGKEAVRIADSFFRSGSGKKIADQKSFTAQYGHILDLSGKDPRQIDEVLVLLMRAPKSYTCEDVVEIQAHGGFSVLQEILGLALKSGARLADKGEFTKRAFLNGRIDLLQAEAVLDLIRSKAEKSARWAASRLEGSLSAQIKKMKEDLLSVLGHLEAGIDFPDDEITPDTFTEISRKLSLIGERLQKLLAGAEIGSIARNGLRVVLWGRPNTGKSSLMNALLRTNRVIVTPHPGTTRDVVEEEIQIQGFPVRLMDTAGIQDTKDLIEKEGIERSQKAAQGADLILFVLDSSQTLSPEDEKLYQEIRGLQKILVLNKSDLSLKITTQSLKALWPEETTTTCSSVRENGTLELEDKIYRFIMGGKVETSDENMIGSVRQKSSLTKTSEAVFRAKEASQNQLSPELIAVDVRLALEELGVLVGDIATDDLLEVLFSQFCIGK